LLFATHHWQLAGLLELCVEVVHPLHVLQAAPAAMRNRAGRKRRQHQTDILVSISML
jgi:hypothetical protein